MCSKTCDARLSSFSFNFRLGKVVNQDQIDQVGIPVYLKTPKAWIDRDRDDENMVR